MKALILLLILSSLQAAPKYQRRQYLTVHQENGLFKTDDQIKSTPEHIKLIYGNGTYFFYQAKTSGFHKLLLEDGRELSLFVSPYDSIHSERSDINWYRTQFDTSTVSNCGPSVVSMGIGWAKGVYTPVSRIRHEIGFQGIGGTSYNQLENALTHHGVEAKQVRLKSLDQIFDAINENQILIFLFNTKMITQSNDPGNSLVGRHYPDSVGHYALIKGYTRDKKYFIVHDPIPSNWSDNSFRHNDNVSMLGQNRYYPADELFNSLRSYTFITIKRNPFVATSNEMINKDWITRYLVSFATAKKESKEENIFYRQCISPANANSEYTVATVMKEMNATDCEDAFKKMIYLTDLNLEKTDVIDLTPIAGLRSLINLRLGGNHFSDISPLAKLPYLQNLFLWGTKIKSIHDLCYMNSLNQVHFWSPHISNFQRECHIIRKGEE